MLWLSFLLRQVCNLYNHACNCIYKLLAFFCLFFFGSGHIVGIDVDGSVQGGATWWLYADGLVVGKYVDAVRRLCPLFCLPTAFVCRRPQETVGTDVYADGFCMPTALCLYAEGAKDDGKSRRHIYFAVGIHILPVCRRHLCLCRRYLAVGI